MSQSNEALQKRVEELEERVAELEAKFESDEEPTQDGDLRSLIKEFDPSTHVERALVIGYHLEQHDVQENFTIDDIKSGYRTAKLKEPANMSDVLANAGERGLMRRDGEEEGLQLWMLTLDGEQTVEEVIET
jgi:hypothetical protein